ncbi:MAG: hypothetical protein IT319_10395 [Anaerolineae bacterium]|nr:hypothetical protein [Anaerolineae bacterium]
MAKRPASGESDPFDLPLDDDIGNLDVDINDLRDLRIEDSGDLDESLLSAVETPSVRQPLTIGGVIGGTLQIILIAVLGVLIVLALGFGVIFGGQQLGLVPTRANATLSIANLLPSQLAPATTAPESIATTTPALPTLTPDLTCAGGVTWWNSQQISDNYAYFTTQAVNDASDPARQAAVLEQMRIRREFVANFPADSCVTEARDALLRGIDATIEVARVATSGDQAALNEKQAAQVEAFAALTAALWGLNINIDADSAPANGVARNGGANCGAQSWYDTIQPHNDTFLATADQIDLTTMTASAVRPLIETMRAERDAIAANTAPICASRAQTLLLGALDSYVQALEQQIEARSASGNYSAYTRQNSLFLAWMRWLGVR